MRNTRVGKKSAASEEAATPISSDFSVNEFPDLWELITRKHGMHKVTLSPAESAVLMELNNRNRTIKEKSLNRLVRILEKDHWRLIGNAVTIDVNGDIVDGQHRLMASVEAQKPITVYLLTGADPDSRDVIDTGARRSFGDALTIHGYRNTSQLAGGIALHQRYLQAADQGRTYTTLSNDPFDHIELREYFEKNPIISEVMSVANVCRKDMKGSPSSWTAFCAFIFEVDTDAANKFISAVRIGANLDTGDPRLALRNYLLRMEKGQRAEKILGIMVKCWNYWRSGRRMQVASLRSDEILLKVI